MESCPWAREPVGRVGIPGLRALPEGEQRFVATELGAASGDLEHGLGGEVRRVEAGRRLGERAVTATVAAQHRQRDEDLGRERDARPERGVTAARRLGQEVVEGKMLQRGVQHIAARAATLVARPRTIYPSTSSTRPHRRTSSRRAPSSCAASGKPVTRPVPASSRSAVGRHKRPTPSTSWPASVPETLAAYLDLSDRIRTTQVAAARDENAPRATAAVSIASAAAGSVRCSITCRNTATRSSARWRSRSTDPEVVGCGARRATRAHP